MIPSVSIITVVYNSETTIDRTIQSVLSQKMSPKEYLIIDGASTDSTVEKALAYKERFEEMGIRFSVVSEPDKGMYDALNKGTRLATGDLVGQINADDWYEPSAIEEMVNFYETSPYDIAWANVCIRKSGKDIVKRAFIGKLWTTAGFCHPAMFSRREILLRYPYALIAMDDDFDMVTRAYKDGVTIRTLNKTITNYSLGGMSTKKSLKNTHYRICMKYDTYKRNGFSPLYWFYCFGIETLKFILG